MCAFNTSSEAVRKLTLNLGTSLYNSINALNVQKRQTQSQMEAKYQQAVADGASYADQIAMRQSQIDKERNSAFPDYDYIKDLETSLKQTRQLGEYEKYRNEYFDAYDGYTTGKSTATRVIATLEKQLNSTTDPKLRSEIRDNLSNFRKQQFEDEKKIMENRIELALNDQSVPTINNIIGDINRKRAQAVADGADTTTYDLQLQNLKQQATSITNAVKQKDLDKTLSEVTNPHERLQYYMDAVNTASNEPFTDPQTKIKYASEKEYWEVQRNEYIQNKFFKEWIQTNADWVDTVSRVNANGWVPNAVPENIMKLENEYKSDPVMAKYASQISATAGEALGKIAENQVNSILATAIASGEYDVAREALNKVILKTGKQAEVSNALNNLEQLQIKNEGQKVMSAKQLEELSSLGIPLPPQMTETAGVNQITAQNSYGAEFNKQAAKSTNQPKQPTQPVQGQAGFNQTVQTPTATDKTTTQQTPAQGATNQQQVINTNQTTIAQQPQNQPIVQPVVLPDTGQGLGATVGSFTNTDRDALNSIVDQGGNLVKLDQTTLDKLSSYYSKVPGLQDYVQSQIGKGSVMGKAGVGNETNVDAISATRVKQLANQAHQQNFADQNPNFDIAKQQGYQTDINAYNKELRKSQGRM